jgi:chemotaxis protein methyltransferase CheR
LDAAFQPPELLDPEFARYQALVQRLTGIHLAPAKKTLLVSRLSSRLRLRGMRTFTEYYKLLQDPAEAAELQTAINLITTNETSFFREPGHFEFLKERLRQLRPLPVPFRVWSAASSSGEEAYSLAMVLAASLPSGAWEVVGSDISTRVLDKARLGHYPLERAEPIPKAYLHAYCLKGSGPHEGTFLVARELRDKVRFHQVNLCGTLPDLGRFDLVFLRNILIYFEPAQKRKVIEALVERLRPGGLLVVGHSESLHGLSDRLAMVQPTIYRGV